MSVKPMQADYAGVTFRSRLEARWAVFLDGIGVKWLYEPQQIKLQHKTAIPDFWLESLQVWMEVKPTQGISRRDSMWPDAKGIVEKTGWPYLMAEGEPGRCLLSVVANVGTEEKLLGPGLFRDCFWCSDGVETNVRISCDIVGKAVFYGNKCRVPSLIPKSRSKSLPANYQRAISQAISQRFD